MNCSMCDDCGFSGISEKIFYEIHVTVETNPSFEGIAKKIGVKPILIDMGEKISPHSMTSSKFDGTDKDALKEAERIADALSSSGLKVERIKIETVPWHPKAFFPDKNQYFETHFAVKLPFDEKELRQFSKMNNLHYSKNLMKTGEHKVQMLTLREYDTNSNLFQKRVESLKTSFLENGFFLDKTIIEFALFDTNVDMDNKWLSRA